MFSALASLGLLMAASAAHATSGYLSTWSSLYPGSASDNNASCQLCHGSSTQNINPYGLAMAQCNGATGTITQRIQAIEGVNSDGDPGAFSNLAETNANTQPGWTTGAVPVWGRNNCVSSGTNTYPGAGDVDPAAQLPNIAVNPTSLSFGIVDVGNSSTLTTTIQNTGTADLNVGALNLAGSTEFSLAAAPTTPFTVAPTASATVDVVYTPIDNGTDNGSLTIASDDPDSPTVTVTLAGTGNVVVPNACNFNVAPASLSFGSVTVGNTSTLQTTVTNDGTAACNITAGVTGSAEFTASPATVTVAANGGTANVSVDYTPVDAGADTGNLNLASNDANNPQSVAVPLSGIGSVVAGDADGDGVADDQDNCIDAPNGPNTPPLNPSIDLNQRDTDGDGFGNVCDPDFNGNGLVDPGDFSLFKSLLGSPTSPDQDLNGNGVVDPADFSVTKDFLGSPPGPSFCDPDGDGICDGGVVQEPTARGDSYTTVRDDVLTVPATRLSGVLYNDFDAQNDPLTATSLDITGTQGLVTLNADGSFTYTPPAGAPAGGAAYLDDTFTYQASDGTNLSAVATVNVRVLPKQTDFKFMMNYELGMHCTGFEFAYCCVLPAYNSIVSQIAKPAIGDPRTSPCFGAACAGNEDNVNFVDAFPRLLEGDPNNGGNLDVLGRETVVRDPELDASGNFKKYVVKYWHDAQSRNDGQGKPQVGNPTLQATLPPYLNTTSLVSDVEGNTLLSWNTRADAAARNADGTFVIGGAECANPADADIPPYATCASINVVQGNGDFGDVGGTFGAPVDNYQNAVWNHLYIYSGTEGEQLCANDTTVHCFTDADCAAVGGTCGVSTDINKARLGLDVDYPTNFGPGGHQMGPVSGGVFNDDAFMTFSEDTGTVVYTQMKLVENLPIMLTSPRIWEALGLPLTPFEDTLGFFADPGLVDEDSIRPYVQMSAQLHEANCDAAGACTAGAAVLGAGGHPVQGFGDAPIDIPNCERCHSAPPTDAQGNVNVNSPNVIPANEVLVELEYEFWAAYYDLDVAAGDSDWYARLKGAAISILGIHDAQHDTQFLANYPAVSPIQPAGIPFNPVTQLGGLSEPFNGAPANCLVNKAPTGPACTTHAQCTGIGDEVCDLPQNTRIGHDSVICQECHGDNVIAVVKSANCGPATSCAEGGLIPALSQALHHNHRSQSEGGDIVFNDALGRDGGCQGCHPAHRSDGVMDGYPIDLDGNNFQASGDNRLASGGCFVGRDVHSNPMKDVDGAETPEHLNTLGLYLSDFVFRNQAAEPGGTEATRGIWCTNCHTQAGQQMWKAENCTDLINNECAPGANPRAAATMQELADMLVTRQPDPALRLAQLESWVDPKDPAIDPDLPLSGANARPADDTHFIWNIENLAEGGTGLCNYVAQWAAAGFNLTEISAQYDGPVALVEVAVPALGGSVGQCQTADALSDAPGGTPVAVCDGAPGIPPGGFFICGSYDADGDFTAALTAPPGESPFCTTQDCKTAADATLAGGGTTGNVTAQIPFSSSDITTASDGRDHWLSAGEPHCADCHAAPYVEQSGNINAFPPFNYPRRASLMRYSRGHQDVTCQGCHESIHGLYPVTPTIDNTSYAQAAALNNDGSHGPLKCQSCHTHVNADQVPTWVDNLSYTDPVNGGPAVPVINDFDAAISWAHTYTDEADPRADVCQNCHGDLSGAISTGNHEWQIHAMVNRVSRVAMDDAEIAQQGAVSGVANPANPYAQPTVCQACHGAEGNGDIRNCRNQWKRHLTEGRVAESVWEEVSIAVGGTTCGW